MLGHEIFSFCFLDVSHPESFVGEALVKLAMEIQVVPVGTVSDES